MSDDLVEVMINYKWKGVRRIGTLFDILLGTERYPYCVDAIEMDYNATIIISLLSSCCKCDILFRSLLGKHKKLPISSLSG